MAREIADDNEAYQVAQWLSQNKDQKGSPRYEQVRTKLALFIDSKPTTSPEEAAQNATPFGKGVLAQRDPSRQEPASQKAAAAPESSAPYNGLPKMPGDTPEPNSVDLSKESALQRGMRQQRQGAEDTIRQFAGPLLLGAAGVGVGLDVAGQFLTGAAKSVYAGWSGLMDTTAGRGMDAAANTINATQEAMGPTRATTQIGAEVGQGVGQTMQVVDEAVKEGAFKLSGGNPEVATAVYTALNMIPIERGFAANMGVRDAARAKIAATRKFYENRGITLGASNMPEQMDAFTKKEFANVPEARGAAIEPLAKDLQNMERKQADIIKTTEGEVNASQGDIYMGGFGKALTDVEQRVRADYAPPMLATKNVKYAVEQLKAIATKVAAAKNKKAAANYVPFQDLIALRTKLKNMGDTGPTAVLHDGLDNYINTQLSAGLIRGDKNLAGNFKFLQDARAKYAATFKPNTEIHRMATQLQASPEEFSNFIFNASDSGYKPAAQATVRELKRIFGANSPQLEYLRLEMVSRAVAPLRGTSPDWGAFIKNYENSVIKNRTLLTELDPYSVKSLEGLYKLAKAHEKIGGPIKWDWDAAQKRAVAELAGNSLARNSAKLGVINTARRFLFGKNQKTVRRALLQELTGIKGMAPMFQPGSAPAQFLMHGMIRESQQQDE